MFARGRISPGNTETPFRQYIHIYYINCPFYKGGQPAHFQKKSIHTAPQPFIRGEKVYNALVPAPGSFLSAPDAARIKDGEAEK